MPSVDPGTSFWPDGFTPPAPQPPAAPPQRLAPARVSADGRLNLGEVARVLQGPVPEAWTPEVDNDWLVLLAGGEPDDATVLRTRWDRRGDEAFPYLRLGKSNPTVRAAVGPIADKGPARRPFTVERLVAPGRLWLRVLP